MRIKKLLLMEAFLEKKSLNEVKKGNSWNGRRRINKKYEPVSSFFMEDLAWFPDYPVVENNCYTNTNSCKPPLYS